MKSWGALIVARDRAWARVVDLRAEVKRALGLAKQMETKARLRVSEREAWRATLAVVDCEHAC